MTYKELVGKYRRLRQELSAAYQEPHWRASYIDRLVDEISATEQSIASIEQPGAQDPTLGRLQQDCASSPQI